MMDKLDRRKFIEKSFLGVASLFLVVNTISCIDDEIVIKKDEKIELPNKIYIANNLFKKSFNNENYMLNDESKVELKIIGMLILKSEDLLNNLNNVGLSYEEYNNTHYKVYFDNVINYTITKDLFLNEDIHYVLEEHNFGKNQKSLSIKEEVTINIESITN